MLEKEIEKIILKEKDVIPFLKKLTPKDKRELVPFLKKLRDKVFEMYDVKKMTKWGLSVTTQHKYSEKRRALIDKACYVCFNKTDIKKALFNVNNLSVSDDYLENIIPWYTPKWYSELINKDIPWGLTYSKTMKLYKDGLLDPSHELILNKLPLAIVKDEWKNGKRTNYYNPEILVEHKETIHEHIWFLFEEESGINNFYNFLHLENHTGENDVWIDTIINLIQEQRLDRKKVLIATIYTSTKGFNKNLSGWFFDLLIKLNPSQEEVLSLQDEFFAALNSPHSKVINTVLKYFKIVANQKKFKYKIFVENASTLLNSETKSVVNSTLMILDKIVKTYRTSNVSVCKKAAEALINIDEKIQLRAAKIIEKYGESGNEQLSDEILMYTDNLFHSSKEILKEYLTSSEEIEENNDEVEEIKTLSEENKIPTYETLDDLIFFVSQAIDNNEVYHIDILLSCMPKLYVLLDKDNVAKLEPIFKRSFDLSMSFDGNSQIGGLELEAAHFINDLAEILMKKYPTELSSFRKTKDQKIKKLKELSYFGSHLKENLKEMENRTIQDRIYQVHRLLFLKSKSLIENGLTLDLISTPTHAPCWIAPEVLIDRIVSYEKRNEKVNLYDFQIAIGRLPIDEHSPELATHIEMVEDEDLKKVLKYHFDLFEIQSEAISRPELWIQSVLSKNKEGDIAYFQEQLKNPLQKEKGAFSWECKQRDQFYMEYDHKLKKQVEQKLIRKELKFEDFDLYKTQPDSFISSLKSVFNKKKKKVRIRSIYEFMHFKKQQYYTSIQPNDDVKFLFLSPNNPSMYLSHVIHNVLQESTFSDETRKKNMVNLLKGLYEIWNRKDFKESTYLFLATGLLCSDKVARTLAAEIWIKANSEKKINNTLLGEIVGKLEFGEYAPLKRFTDLLTTNLFNISKNHNAHLLSLLDHMIGHMYSDPIRGIKKLLEILLEILLELKFSFPQTQISELAKLKLSKWKDTKSLYSVINKIEK